MSTNHKKNSLPANEEIQQHKKQFSERAERVISGIERVGAKETVTDKLELIRNELMLFKDKHIAYTIIQQLIKDEFDLVVSDFTLRKFCQNELGFPKRSQSNNTVSEKTQQDAQLHKKHDQEDPFDVFDRPIDEPKIASNFDAKSALSNSTDFD